MKLEWIEPKTDWYGYTDSNNDYQGDRFNAADYNRIKNNIQVLHDLAAQIYTNFDISDMGDDKTYADYPYADEINLMEDNFQTIVSKTINNDYGTKPVFMDNGAFIGYEELNRLEGAQLDMYNKLQNQYKGRRMFQFMLGTKGDF